MAFEKRKMLRAIMAVIVETVVSVQLLLMWGRMRGDRIDRKVFLLDPWGRIGGEGMVVEMVGWVVGMPFIVDEIGGVVDDIFVGINEDILEQIVVVRRVEGMGEGGVLERHCRRTTDLSPLVLYSVADPRSVVQSLGRPIT